MGILIADEDVSAAIPGYALEQLRNDPDRHKRETASMDEATMTRAYFHASFDSKNAHSWLCRAIAKDVRGTFAAEYSAQTSRAGKPNPVEELYALSTMMTALRAFDVRANVRCVVAERAGLSIAKLESMKVELDRTLLASVADLPMFPAYFPAVEFVLRPASEPGIQVCDFLLWAVNRRESFGETTWLDRIKAPFAGRVTGPKNTWGGQSLYLGGGAHQSKDYYEVADLRSDSDLATDEYAAAIEEVEGYLQTLVTAKGGIPAPARHFAAQLTDATNLRSVKGEDDRYVALIAETYVKLFDLIPRIGPTAAPDERSWLLRCRAAMACALRTDRVPSMLFRTRLVATRRLLLK